VVALTSGCIFGGDDGKTTRTTKTTAATGGGTGTTAAPLGTADDLPDAWTKAFQTRPIVVFFYVPGSADDASVLDALNRLRTSFDRYEFLIYDYKDPEAYGGLVQLLGVKSVPCLKLVDGAGILRQTFSGYVDEGTLNQALVNLGRD
jgi:thioredoxin-like negative regulator of GroEL